MSEVDFVPYLTSPFSGLSLLGQIRWKEIGPIKIEKDSKDVVDNLPVSVEFNQSYKLLLVSCLPDQKKIPQKTKITWLDTTNWQEPNQKGVLQWRKKKMKERKRKILCLCYVEVLSIAVETCYFWKEDFKDMSDTMHSD